MIDLNTPTGITTAYQDGFFSATTAALMTLKLEEHNKLVTELDEYKLEVGKLEVQIDQHQAYAKTQASKLCKAERELKLSEKATQVFKDTVDSMNSVIQKYGTLNSNLELCADQARTHALQQQSVIDDLKEKTNAPYVADQSLKDECFRLKTVKTNLNIMLGNQKDTILELQTQVKTQIGTITTLRAIVDDKEKESKWWMRLSQWNESLWNIAVTRIEAMQAQKEATLARESTKESVDAPANGQVHANEHPPCARVGNCERYYLRPFAQVEYTEV